MREKTIYPLVFHSLANNICEKN